VTIKLAKSFLKLIGIYNPSDEDVATLCMRLNLDLIPIKIRPFLLIGFQLLHMTLIKPPTDEEILDED